MRRRSLPLWPILVALAIGTVVVYGGFSVFGDQRTGTPGTATVTECQGGHSKYQRGISCRGTWSVGGDAILGDGELVVGSVEGAGYGDVGQTIDVRIHGTDHATKPALATPIVLWSLGGSVLLLGLWGLWRWTRGDRSPATLAVPEPIRERIVEAVRQVWRGDPQRVIDGLPRHMPPGAVQRLVSGGAFGWRMEARLDQIEGRVSLEVLEEDRMGGPRHYRVWQDGTIEALISELTGHPVPADPVEADRIERAYVAHNRRVQEQLRARGFSSADRVVPELSPGGGPRGS